MSQSQSRDSVVCFVLMEQAKVTDFSAIHPAVAHTDEGYPALIIHEFLLVLKLHPFYNALGRGLLKRVTEISSFLIERCSKGERFTVERGYSGASDTWLK